MLMPERMRIAAAEVGKLVHFVRFCLQRTLPLESGDNKMYNNLNE